MPLITTTRAIERQGLLYLPKEIIREQQKRELEAAEKEHGLECIKYTQFSWIELPWEDAPSSKFKLESICILPNQFYGVVDNILRTLDERIDPKLFDYVRKQLKQL